MTDAPAPSIDPFARPCGCLFARTEEIWEGPIKYTGKYIGIRCRKCGHEWPADRLQEKRPAEDKP